MNGCLFRTAAANTCLLCDAHMGDGQRRNEKGDREKEIERDSEVVAHFYSDLLHGKKGC